MIKLWCQREMKPSPPCESCVGLCCTNKSGWQFVELDKREQVNPTFAGRVTEFEKTTKVGFYYEDGACPFLDRLSRRCTIYHERPRICRGFDCRIHTTPQFFRLNPSMIDLIVTHETNTNWTPPLA